jgi:hypothetical protein
MQRQPPISRSLAISKRVSMRRYSQYPPRPAVYRLFRRMDQFGRFPVDVAGKPSVNLREPHTWIALALRFSHPVSAPGHHWLVELQNFQTLNIGSIGSSAHPYT